MVVTVLLRGGLAVGAPSYDAVLAEHLPQWPGGASCRSCGFVYSDDERACPAVILAEAGFAEMADRVRVVPAADREYGALCELTVAVQRMDARLEAIGAGLAAAALRRTAVRGCVWRRLGAMLGPRRRAAGR